MPLLLQEGKLSASEELGDLFKSASDWDTAQAIYQQSGASGKVVEALAAKGDFAQLVGWFIVHHVHRLRVMCVEVCLGGVGIRACEQEVCVSRAASCQGTRRFQHSALEAVT